jgi:hypothetical protein
MRVQIFEVAEAQFRKKEVPMMTPPNVGAPRQKTCKT